MKPDIFPQRRTRPAALPDREPVGNSTDVVPECTLSSTPVDSVANGNGKIGTSIHIDLHPGGNGNGNHKNGSHLNGDRQAMSVVADGLARNRVLPLEPSESGGMLAFESVLPVPRSVTNGNGVHAETVFSDGRVVAEPWPEVSRPRPSDFYLRHGKRLLDILGAVTGLVFSIPILLVFGALIRLGSRGPVFFKSTRLGKNGKPFTFLKLRSMYSGADRDRDNFLHLNEVDGPVFKLSRDPRTTRIGRFMRKTSIDEIPQFFNVLRGEMSLVGPRPPLPGEVAKYEEWQKQRLDVKPGLTCLWQISGRSRLGFNEWMRLDLDYIKHQSFWTDVKIVLRTIPAVISRDGAY